jgi:hypothetical protein
LLASFFLNRFFVGLQTLNPLCIEIIFLLFLRDPLLERLILHPLLFVDNHAVRAEHHMHEKQTRKQRDRDCRYAPPQGIHTRPKRTSNLHPRRSQRLGLWSSFGHRAQPILRTGKSPDS